MIILLVILAIIAIAGFAITTALRKGLDPKDEYDKDRLKILGIIRGAVIGGCVVIFAIAMLIGSVKIMDQTEVGIVKTFGKVDHTVSGGLNFVNPISDTVEVMDLRVHVNEASFASYTKDAQPLTAAIEYQYEPIAAQAMQIVSQYGSYEILETKLRAAVLAAEGEARALEITREALENMPDTWIAQQYLEKWDGKLPQFITGDGSGLMLTPNLEQ